MSCFKCGMMGHWARDCFVRSSLCTRCGRHGHWIQDCFARSTKDGQSLEKKNHLEVSEIKSEMISGKGQVSRKRIRPAEGEKRNGVYVLEYQDGNVYVGKSNDIDARIRQHARRTVICTSQWQGSPKEVSPITPRLDDHESWERNETLERMSKQGVEKVRGWMYTTRHLSEDTIENIDAQLCEKYDLCRVCGTKGHFASACSMSVKMHPATAYNKSSYKKKSDGEYEDDSSCFGDSIHDEVDFSSSSGPSSNSSSRSSSDNSSDEEESVGDRYCFDDSGDYDSD